MGIFFIYSVKVALCLTAFYLQYKRRCYHAEQRHTVEAEERLAAQEQLVQQVKCREAERHLD